MSFLTAAQNAAIQLIGKKPPTFFSSDSQFCLEITTLANEIIADIVRDKDWRKLIKLKLMTGDSITQGFDLPLDYDHMPKGQQVHNASWPTWNYYGASSLDEWLNYLNGEPQVIPGAWLILSGQMQFNPIIPTGQVAQYYYVSNQIVLEDGTGSTKSQFTADSDTMLYPDRLLTLGLIWRWRAMKRLEYAEDMANFEKMKDQVAGEDKGSRILRDGGRRNPWWDVQSPYPWALGS